MNQVMKIVDSILNVSLGLVVGLLLVSLGTIAYKKNFTKYAMKERIQEMYRNIWVQTGQNQEILPLKIVDSDEINAYNDGKEIVLYTGLINTTKNMDELALVLGHEIAHGNLWHLRMLNEWLVAKTDSEVSVLEANADKMGAVYIMKAGYDVCKGREWFKTMLKSFGDYQGGNHPGYAYRYNELNINCD